MLPPDALHCCLMAIHSVKLWTFSKVPTGGSDLSNEIISVFLCICSLPQFIIYHLLQFLDRYVPNLLKSLRSQKIVYISCGEDHTAVLTKVCSICLWFQIWLGMWCKRLDSSWWPYPICIDNVARNTMSALWNLLSLFLVLWC